MKIDVASSSSDDLPPIKALIDAHHSSWDLERAHESAKSSSADDDSSNIGGEIHGSLSDTQSSEWEQAASEVKRTAALRSPSRSPLQESPPRSPSPAIGATNSYSSLQSFISGVSAISMSSTSTVSSISSAEHPFDSPFDSFPLIFMQDLQQRRAHKINGLQAELQAQRLEVARAKAKLKQLRSGLPIKEDSAPLVLTKASSSDSGGAQVQAQAQAHSKTSPPSPAAKGDNGHKERHGPGPDGIPISAFAAFGPDVQQQLAAWDTNCDRLLSPAEIVKALEGLTGHSAALFAPGSRSASPSQAVCQQTFPAACSSGSTAPQAGSSTRVTCSAPEAHQFVPKRVCFADDAQGCSARKADAGGNSRSDGGAHEFGLVEGLRALEGIEADSGDEVSMSESGCSDYEELQDYDDTLADDVLLDRKSITEVRGTLPRTMEAPRPRSPSHLDSPGGAAPRTGWTDSRTSSAASVNQPTQLAHRPASAGTLPRTGPIRPFLTNLTTRIKTF